MSLRERFLNFDDLLASKGVPPLTEEWWRPGLGNWLDAYERNRVLEIWGCVGRGAAKSTAIYKLALFFTLFGDFKIPPGERHFAVVLSRLKEEAAKGIAIIDAWLTLLRIDHRTAGDVIELNGMPRGIRVVAASVAASSGWRAFFIGKDERSKWASSEIEDVDAEETDTSASAMTATHEFAPVIAFGSAWGNFGAFHAAITGGSDASRFVLGPAPTWVAAPHITEESTHRKERDLRKWAREYACEFQSAITSALDPDHVRAAYRPFRHGCPLSAPVMGFDSSMGRGDSTAWMLAQWWQPNVTDEERYETIDGEAPGIITFATDAHGLRKQRQGYTPPKAELCIYAIGELKGRFADRGVTSDDVVDQLAELALQNNVRCVFADQFQAFALASAFAKHRLAYCSNAWTQESKGEALLRLRSLLADRVIAIEPSEGGDTLVKQLCNLSETIRPSGSIGLGARRGHDDVAAALLSLMIADNLGAISGSPIAIDRRLRTD